MQTNELSFLTDFVTKCIKCGACNTACRALRALDNRTPADLVESIVRGSVDGEILDFVLRCSLCGLCNFLCPQGLDLVTLIRTIRGLLVKKGVVDPEWYRSLWVDHDWNLFTVFRRNYGIQVQEKTCTSLLFPGCMMANVGGELVLSSARWLTTQGEDVGISLRCCGAPLDQIGLKERFDLYAGNLWNYIRSSGASRVITVCPTCHALLSKTKGGCDIEVQSLYELMADSGLHAPVGEGSKVTIHDSCADRYGLIGKNVRDLLQDFSLAEMEHHGRNTICCGSGGLVSAIDPLRCSERAERRLREAHEVQAQVCVTYCMACAHRLHSQESNISVRHILELVFNKKVDYRGFDEKMRVIFDGENTECRDLINSSKRIVSLIQGENTSKASRP